MATQKATTTSDVKDNVLGESSELPQVEQASVEELSSPEILANPEQPKTVKVKSPTGSVTEVPESIVDALTDSGYSKSK